MWRNGDIAPPFLTSELHGSEQSASHHDRFPLPLQEITPGNHWIGGWVGPRANLDAVKRKIFPCQESNPSCPAIAHHNTNSWSPTSTAKIYELRGGLISLWLYKDDNNNKLWD
jgi:hypothetical protein